MLPQLRAFKKRDLVLSLFFAAKMHWTVAMSQMIQDDLQLTFDRDPTGNRQRWKNEQKRLLERKGKDQIKTLSDY